VYERCLSRKARLARVNVSFRASVDVNNYYACATRLEHSRGVAEGRLGGCTHSVLFREHAFEKSRKTHPDNASRPDRTRRETVKRRRENATTGTSGNPGDRETLSDEVRGVPASSVANNACRARESNDVAPNRPEFGTRCARTRLPVVTCARQSFFVSAGTCYPLERDEQRLERVRARLRCQRNRPGRAASGSSATFRHATPISASSISITTNAGERHADRPSDRSPLIPRERTP